MGLKRKRTTGRQPGLERKPMQQGERPMWDEHEEETADLVPGGQRVPGSGSSSTRRSRKGDVTSPLFRVSNKATKDGEKGLRLTVEHLEEIRALAADNRQTPAFALRVVEERWIAFPDEIAGVLMSIVDAIIQGDAAEARALAAMLERVE